MTLNLKISSAKTKSYFKMKLVKKTNLRKDQLKETTNKTQGENVTPWPPPITYNSGTHC